MKTKGSSTTVIEQIQGVLNVTIQGTGQSSILKQHGFGSPAMDFLDQNTKLQAFFNSGSLIQNNHRFRKKHQEG